MKLGKPLAAVAGTLLALAITTSAYAWDSEGHRIIARLAYERLTPAAKAAVDGLISHSPDQQTPTCPVANLEDAAVWPDCIRPLDRFAYLSVMHYENVPICGAVPESIYCPNGKCVVDETRRAIAILEDRSRSQLERLQALEEVAHFIGDMHQPLHAADNGDRGGTDVHVIVDGHSTHLHHVWDTEVIQNALGTSDVRAAAELERLVKRYARAWTRGGLDDWLAQAHEIAVSYVYPKLAEPPACHVPARDQAIGQAYLDGAAPIVRAQLGRAAVRLAAVLNRILG